MSGHADTIRHALIGGSPAFQREVRDESLAALDALEAESQQLFLATLDRIDYDAQGHRARGFNIDVRLFG